MTVVKEFCFSPMSLPETRLHCHYYTFSFPPSSPPLFLSSSVFPENNFHILAPRNGHLDILKPKIYFKKTYWYFPHIVRSPKYVWDFGGYPKKWVLKSPRNIWN